MRRLVHFWGEVLRTRWIVGIPLAAMLLRLHGVLNPGSPITVVLTRPVGLCTGLVIAHIAVQQLFPYLDMGDLLERATDRERSENERWIDALLFMGAAIKRGLIYAGCAVAGAMAFGV
jgi:hypothetical protein